MNSQQASEKLKRLAIIWPAEISLFSVSGRLAVVDEKGKILAWIDIPNDGGDPGVEERGDGQYLYFPPMWE